VLDRVREQRHDVVVAAEVGEVLEGEVDGTGQRARAAQLAELVALSLPAGHVLTMRQGADRSLPCG
jgi:hypothetical protein